MARDKVVLITDLKYVSRTIVIKSERISYVFCANLNPIIKLIFRILSTNNYIDH